MKKNIKNENDMVEEAKDPYAEQLVDAENRAILLRRRIDEAVEQLEEKGETTDEH